MKWAVIGCILLSACARSNPPACVYETKHIKQGNSQYVLDIPHCMPN